MKWHSEKATLNTLKKKADYLQHQCGTFDKSALSTLVLVTHLDYYDFVPSSYLVVNLNSLVEANLDLLVTVNHTWLASFALENDNITSNPTNLFKGMRNVQIMNLLSHDSFGGYLHYDTYSSVCECLSGYSFLMSCPVKVSFVQMPYQGRVALIRCTSEQTLIVHLVALAGSLCGIKYYLQVEILRISWTP
ncbi:hypothetical protein F2Q68_00003729 [Brassica cretica]|uniref:Uncharacterized protein n=1 Tax=Brassica cretica TaxID=69181 RepID=A0A8S9JHP0_BRACR|nr:hypothetical protein F2Q68_00003729 [Brassica cretica]